MSFEEFIDYVYDSPYNYLSRRYLRDVTNPLEYYDDDGFQKRLGFRKDTIVHVLLSPNANRRRFQIPPVLQLLIAVRCYATGVFQIVSGDLQHLSQPVVSKIVARISKELALKVAIYDYI